MTDDPLTIIHGDCVAVMRGMEPESVDAIVTDPPYGLAFMGKKWDAFTTRADEVTPRGQGHSTSAGPYLASRTEVNVGGLAFQQWTEAWAREALRVLRPGGYMLAAGGTRTFHRMVCAIEDAGFEIRDTVCWLTGQGFPKSLNVSKALRALPACSCDVPSEIGTVNASDPSGSVRAGVGTEPRAVPLTGFPADSADGIGPNVGADAPHALADVKPGTEGGDGHDAPVVLWASDVATRAEGDEIVRSVGSVKAAPEPLGNDMVGDQVVGTSAVSASPVTGDDLGGDERPLGTAILPLAAAPRRVSVTDKSASVVGGHAGPRAVDGAALPVTDGHGPAHRTGEPHALHCNTCGGVRRDAIPGGLGTALKPAVEFFTLARKPLIGTVAANVKQFGTGALNIDGTRIGTDETWDGRILENAKDGVTWGGALNRSSSSHPKGRWPANVLLDEEAAAMLDEQAPRTGGQGKSSGPTFLGRSTSVARGVFNGVEDTPFYGGQLGGASRFFYTAKASKSERNGSTHPTVKPVDLMRWLVRLVTPPGGVVLDPFAGSGTTGQAALAEGFRCILIEREAEYVEGIKTCRANMQLGMGWAS